MNNNEIQSFYEKALTDRQTRRTLLRRAGAVGIAFPFTVGLLAACGGDDDDESPTETSGPSGAATSTAPGSGGATTEPDEDEPTEEATEASSDEARGGDLVIGWLSTQEPANLDSQVDPYASAYMIDSFVTDSPVLLTTEQEYAPMLATSWEVTPDATEWTFVFKEDVMFQDGMPFNAEAFKANIDRIMDPDTQSALRASSLGSGGAFNSVEVIDEYSAKMIYNDPWVTVIPSISSTPIWSPDAFEQYGDDFTDHLTGCGAFKLVEWTRGSEITFEKWPEYQGGAPNQDHDGPAYLDTITIKLVGEQAILGEVLQTGEVDMVYQLPFQSIPTYEDNSDYLVVPTYQGGTGNMFNFNLEHPPLDDVRVREAIRRSYDPQDLNDTLYDGLYLTMYGPLSRFTRCYWDGAEEFYEYDPELSKSLLDEAGWVEGSDGIREKDGEKLSLVGVVISSQELLEYLEPKFREIGVELQIELVPGPVQLERAVGGDFDLMFEHLSSVEPDVLDLVWNSANLKPGGWAWSRFSNERVDELLNETKQVADPDERCELFVEVQQIVTENVPALPTVSTAVVYAMSSNVKGFQVGGAVRSYFYVNNMYIEE